MINQKHIFIQFVVLCAGQHLQYVDIDSDYLVLISDNLNPELKSCLS